MKLLLDTHVLLWALGAPSKIPPRTRAKLESRSNTVYASVASAWEIEIKRSLGKLKAPDDLEEQLRAASIEELPCRGSHVRALRSLPPIHRDPFDRMLIAQALAESLVLVTGDDVVASYSVRTIRV
jgi:PIN domain nuclease of toxin-antitoxin system